MHLERLVFLLLVASNAEAARKLREEESTPSAALSAKTGNETCPRFYCAAMKASVISVASLRQEHALAIFCATHDLQKTNKQHLTLRQSRGTMNTRNCHETKHKIQQKPHSHILCRTQRTHHFTCGNIESQSEAMAREPQSPGPCKDDVVDTTVTSHHHSVTALLISSLIDAIRRRKSPSHL